MTLALSRTRWAETGIYGTLADGALPLAVTLEHAYPDGNGHWEPKIPLGTYPCTRYLSPKRGYVVWLLKDVPGHDYCEIHIGNKNIDSDGCILVGDELSGDDIAHSKLAFDRLMAYTADEQTLHLVVQ